MSRSLRLLLLLPLLAAAALLVLACREAAPQAASGLAPEAESVAARAPLRAPEQVDVERVVRGSLVVPIESSGSVRARRVSRIGAEVSGRLVQVYVDVGNRVEAGDPLFQVDPLPFAMTLAEADAMLTLARAERDNALGERARIERLMQQGAASERLRDDQQMAAVVSVARVAQLVVQLERARNDLERTLVRAPYAGSIVERLAHEGEMATGQPVVTLQETRALEVVLDIPESAQASVRVGSRAQVFIEGLVEPIETVVDRVSDRVDDATRTYEVHAQLVDPTGTAKAGSYARALVVPLALEPRPLLDRSALLMRDGRSYVFRVNGDTVEQVLVRVRAISDRRAEIVSGVEEGDLVVRGEAVRRLADGDRVELRGAPPPIAAATEGRNAS